MKSNLFNILIVILLLLIVGLYVLLQKDDAENKNIESDKFTSNTNLFDNSVKKSDLVFEFLGAYDKDAKANGNIVNLDMIAEESEVEIFDGVKTKVWAYNKTVPGPEIRIKLGDTLKINFKNNLPQETTIHFHGVRVPNAMDGVPGVTQDPIKPGDSFIYEFTPKDAGTYWFHPHVRSSEQVERGLFGTLIVEDDNSKKYSQDVVWVIDDWRMTKDYQVYPRFVTPMDLMHDGRWGNVITVNGKLNERLKVRPGERILLRLVNTSNARIYLPKFEGLNAKIIAVDGMYVKEVFDLGDLELSPGNRIDLDIKIPLDLKGREFILKDYFTKRSVNNLASIYVDGDRVESLSFDYPVNTKVPNWKGADKLQIDKEYILDARRKKNKTGQAMMGDIEWTINGKAYPDYDPYTLKYGEFNKIRFKNNSGRLHPMHLHGQFFKVIARNGIPVNESHFRDTVLVRPKESVDIATVPLDKGLWVNHCHILEHAEAGMITAVKVE